MKRKRKNEVVHARRLMDHLKYNFDSTLALIKSKKYFPNISRPIVRIIKFVASRKFYPTKSNKIPRFCHESKFSSTKLLKKAQLIKSRKTLSKK